MRNDNILIKYPVKMKPACKDYIWGGDRLIREWGKECVLGTMAESWELSAHPSGQSTAANGPLSGLPLAEVVAAFGRGCLGSHAEPADRFPILIKLIDPRQSLSIQVHPDDRYARLKENDRGKTEMWYIAEAGPEGSILCGFRRDITREEYRKAIADHTLPDLMNRVSVKPGDVFLIKPGTVHAIGADVIIAEIQQNSDLTYRVYDFGRKGADGKERTLHIDKALDVSDLNQALPDGKSTGSLTQTDFGTARVLASCRYFTVMEYRSAAGSMSLQAGTDSFAGILFLSGSGYVRHNGTDTAFVKGDTFFIPAGMGDYEIIGETLFLMAAI